MSGRTLIRVRGLLAPLLAPIAAMLIAFAAIAVLPGTADASHDHRPRAPRVELQQDGPMLEITWNRMAKSGADLLAYRLTGVDREFTIEGETEQPQLKLVLRNGESYTISVRSHHPWQGWSRWSRPVKVTAGIIRAHPWTVQVEAGDGKLTASWADVDADSYPYRVWSRDGHYISGSTEGTTLEIDSLKNGTKYFFTMRAQYGKERTGRTPSLPVTPNAGQPVSIALRDYETEPLTGPIRQEIPTAVVGDGDRIKSVRVSLSPTTRRARSVKTEFDPSAIASSGITGAWVTEAVLTEPLDYEVITKVRGRDGVLASSLQTWLLGTVDAFAPDASPNTRVGTYR